MDYFILNVKDRREYARHAREKESKYNRERIRREKALVIGIICLLSAISE